VNIFASTSVPFILTTVQVPNLALTHKKWITVHVLSYVISVDCTLKRLKHEILALILLHNYSLSVLATYQLEKKINFLTFDARFLMYFRRKLYRALLGTNGGDIEGRF
jgi:hypothetical protein